MGDEYEDLVELGFEGVDRFATHFHDKAAAFVGHHYHANAPQWLGRRGRDPNTDHRQEEKREKEETRELSPSERESASPRAPEPQRLYPDGQLPPPEEHLNWNGGYRPQQRSGRQRIPLQQPRIEDFLPKASAVPSLSTAPSQARERKRVGEDGYHIDRGADRSGRGDRNHRRMHRESGRSRRQRDWSDDDGYERDVEEGTYYGYATDDAERPRFERRRSSWSPRRRRLSDHDWEEAQRRRPRSKSPNHNRMVAMFVGAVAGGVAGSRLKKSEAIPSSVATLAGAVVGGIGAREVEKLYDEYKGQRREKAWKEEGLVRERRR